MIGFFDSGIGGLTVLQQVRAVLPNTPLMYVADQACNPYGSRSPSAVMDRSFQITQYLRSLGAQLVVVACNTATALAVDQLRRHFSIPIVGVEPGIKPAALQTQRGRIGIMATENTLASKRYAALVHRFVPNVEIINQPCHGLADAIEHCSDQYAALIERYLCPMLDQRIDQLVLGCTHYPLAMDALQRCLQKASVNLVDTSHSIALEIKRRYLALPFVATSSCPTIRLTTTADSVILLHNAIDYFPLLRSLSHASLETVSLTTDL